MLLAEIRCVLANVAIILAGLAGLVLGCLADSFNLSMTLVFVAPAATGYVLRSWFNGRSGGLRPRFAPRVLHVLFIGYVVYTIAVVAQKAVHGQADAVNILTACGISLFLALRAWTAYQHFVARRRAVPTGASS